MRTTTLLTLLMRERSEAREHQQALVDAIKESNQLLAERIEASNERFLLTLKELLYPTVPDRQARISTMSEEQEDLMWQKEAGIVDPEVFAAEYERMTRDLSQHSLTE